MVPGVCQDDAACASDRAGPLFRRAIDPALDRCRPSGPIGRAGGAFRQVDLFAIGNIHAGEVCGKEALPMLLREICSSPHPALLKDVILAVAPIYNTDGNERVSKTNRPGQVGPEEGMGQRANARGLDLNRDFVKLEAPETQGLVRFLNQWNPHLFIDTHTTNGSYHRYTITYEGPKNPAGDPEVIEFMRKTFFPEVGAAFEKRTDLKAFYYGNFNREHTQWTTYPAEARYGTTYVGLRNRLSVLSEAYSYAPYKTRVLATRDFVRECLETAVKHKAEITKLLDASSGGRQRDHVFARPTRSSRWRSGRRSRSAGEPATVLGYVETQENGRRKKTDTTKDYTLQLMNEFEPAASVTRPFAYLVPAAFPQAIEALKRHGLDVQELREDLELDVEVYRLDKVERSPRRFEGHQAARADRHAAPRVPDDQGRNAGGAHGPTAGQPGRVSARAGLGGWSGHLEFLRRRVERGRRFPGRAAAAAGTDVRQPGRAAA